MTRYVAADTDTVVKVEFIDTDGEYHVPSSATYTLLDNAKNVVDGLEDIPVPNSSPGEAVVFITIPASANGKSRQYEVRYLIVRYYINTIEYNQTGSYLILDNVFLPVTPEDVKAILGTPYLESHYIDVFSAYNQVQALVPNVNIQQILENGTELFPYAVDAIKLKAALNTNISIQNTMMQSEQADNTLYRRFENQDFTGMYDSLLLQFEAALAMLQGTQAGLVNSPIFLVTTDSDPVTGE